MQLEITIEELRQLISVGNVPFGQHAMTENHWLKLSNQLNDENKQLRDNQAGVMARLNSAQKEIEELKTYKIQVREIISKYRWYDQDDAQYAFSEINKLSQ